MASKMTAYRTERGNLVDALGEPTGRCNVYVRRPTGETEPCPGAAHSNPHVDHCGLCAPRWGVVDVLHPVDLDAAARAHVLVPAGILDDAQLDRLLADPAVERVEVRVRSTWFTALRLPMPG